VCSMCVYRCGATVSVDVEELNVGGVHLVHPDIASIKKKNLWAFPGFGILNCNQLFPFAK